MTAALWPSVGRADTEFQGLHLDYALGGATGDHSGVRHNLDFAVMAGSFPEGTGMKSRTGWIAGGSIATGLGVYPTYFCAPEVGVAWTEVFGFPALGAVAGPALRVDPTGFGGGLRADFALFIHVGVRALAVVDPDGNGELQVTGMVGFGRF